MAINYPTPPICGGERPRLPSSQVGPVTQAIRAMRAPTWHLHAADPDRQRVRELRRQIAERIEADIALLDALDGDADQEPSLGSPEVGPFDQSMWADGGADDGQYDAGDDREQENEHGGDVQDEPHDADEDERDTAIEWPGDGLHVFSHGGRFA